MGMEGLTCRYADMPSLDILLYCRARYEEQQQRLARRIVEARERLTRVKV